MRLIEKKVSATAPATVANVSCGFDVLGFALDYPEDRVTIVPTDRAVRIRSIDGDAGKLPRDPLKNSAGVAALAFLKDLGIRSGVDIALHKGLPLGSGLGSSAASGVATIHALNSLLENPLPKKALLPYALAAEKAACGIAHADNAAAALLGGFILVRGYEPLDVVELDFPADLYCSLVCPHISVHTGEARKILPRMVSLADATRQWGNLGGLVAGLYRQDYELISRSLTDGIVEPVRSKAIPAFKEIKESALAGGALGCGISGSGPAVFALCRGQAVAKAVNEKMQAVLHDHKISCIHIISPLNRTGARILPEPL